MDHWIDLALQALMANRFKISFTGSDFDLQHIFSWRDDANEFFVIRTRGMISHIEVQNHLVIRQDLGIDIPSAFVGLPFVCAILKRNEKHVAQNRFVDLDGIFLPVQGEMEFPVTKIPLVRPFVRQKGGIVFWVIDMKNEPINPACKDILWVERIVS